MSSQLSAHAITAHTAMTRISVSRCSTLPAHRGSARVEKCSTSFSTDIAILPSSIKGEPAQPVSPSEPARPFHASPLSITPGDEPDPEEAGAAGWLGWVEFSAHGLRSGCLTETARRGIPLVEAMQQSQHRSVQQAASDDNEGERQRGRAAQVISRAIWKTAPSEYSCPNPIRQA